jgi:hypothetical protein
MTTRTGRKIDAWLKARIALEALREQATLCLEEAAAGSAGVRERQWRWRRQA